MNEEEFLKEHPSLKGKTHRIETFEIGKISCQRLVNGIIEDMGEYPEDALPNIPDLITKPKEPNEFYGKTLGYIKDDVVDIQDIHETQIDKIKVNEIIDKFEPSKWNQMDRFDDWFRKELKKELGLK